ncbi:MAG TPA: hypothetical protein VKZ85_14435 [Woeseiaceae bacterium]|nr:hypothetical protein [Woeseiaceae bacterium]
MSTDEELLLQDLLDMPQAAFDELLERLKRAKAAQDEANGATDRSNQSQ